MKEVMCKNCGGDSITESQRATVVYAIVGISEGCFEYEALETFGDGDVEYVCDSCGEISKEDIIAKEE